MRYVILSALFCLLLVSCSKNESKLDESKSAPPSSAPGTVSGHLAWQAPDGWVVETPSSAMRMAQFRLPGQAGAEEDASAVVFYFHGEGGSVQANIDRWYTQITQPDGRPSKDAAKVTKKTVNGLQQTRVDVSGTYQQMTTPMGPVSAEKPNYRMLAAVIETSSGPWFVKLTGPENTVAHWEKSYYEFLDSVRMES
jgi:hypothetical protein